MKKAQQLLYLRDVYARIRDVDAYLSTKARCKASSILVCTDRPQKGTGYHVNELASYYPTVTLADINRPIPFLKKKEDKPDRSFSAYLLYAPVIVQLIERTLKRTSISGHGDAALSEFWNIIAVVLTRYRVLAHKEFFPNCKLRVREDMIKHRLLFTTGTNELEGLRNMESQYAQLTPADRSDVHDVDIFWTLQLVVNALESGRTREESWDFITSI